MKALLNYSSLISVISFWISLTSILHAEDVWTKKFNELFEGKEELIVINGHSSVNVHAEEMKLRIPVTTNSKDLAEAYQENKKLTESLISQLKEVGFPEDLIALPQFSYSQHLNSAHKKGKNERYNILTHTIVTVSNPDQFILLADVLNDNVEPYDQIRYFHSKDSEYRETVLIEAIDMLKAQKKLIESSFGVKLELITLEKNISYPSADSLKGSQQEKMEYKAKITAKFRPAKIY